MWLKKYLKPLIFLFIALSVLASWYINEKNPDLTIAQKQQLDQMLAGEVAVKSHVWNFNRLAVGVIKGEVKPGAYAVSICNKAAALGAKPESVEVVDVIKLQQSGGEEWEEIGYAKCR